MTRPHPVEGKPRTRKPEAVLREFRAVLEAIRKMADDDTAPIATSRRALELLAELRRSLRDTRGAK